MAGMHIGLVIYGTLDLQSGGFLDDRQIVRALEEMGERITVISLPWRSYLRSLADNLDVAVGNRMASGGWDVVVEDELAHPALIRPNRRVRDLHGPPVVSLIHLLLSESRPWPRWKRWFFRQVERRYLGGVDGCIYVSRWNQVLAEALLGSAKPATIAYPAGDHLRPAVDMATILHRAERTGPLEIASLGSVIPRKALHVLLQALAGIPEVNWQLRVIGSLQVDPEYSATVQRQAHLAGDQLLRAMTERLLMGVRASDTISRQGDDEFVVLLADIQDVQDIHAIAQKLLALGAEPFELGGHAASASFSIGISVYPTDGGDFDVLLRQADTALYHAKESGRNTYRFFTAEMNAAALERMRLENSLQDGVKTLVARQNEDGGWGWWPGQDTDLTITAYVLLGLGTGRGR